MEKEVFESVSFLKLFIALLLKLPEVPERKGNTENHMPPHPLKSVSDLIPNCRKSVNSLNPVLVHLITLLIL